LGDCFLWAVFLITGELQSFWLLFSTDKATYICINFEKKLLGKQFGRFFSQTHLVTLPGEYFLSLSMHRKRTEQQFPVFQSTGPPGFMLQARFSCPSGLPDRIFSKQKYRFG
jgi:hypothetical protein